MKYYFVQQHHCLGLFLWIIYCRTIWGRIVERMLKEIRLETLLLLATWNVIKNPLWGGTKITSCWSGCLETLKNPLPSVIQMEPYSPVLLAADSILSDMVHFLNLLFLTKVNAFFSFCYIITSNIVFLLEYIWFSKCLKTFTYI